MMQELNLMKTDISWQDEESIIDQKQNQSIMAGDFKEIGEMVHDKVYQINNEEGGE